MRTDQEFEASGFLVLASSVVLAVVLLVGCAPAEPTDVEPTCEGSLQDLVDNASPGAVVEAAGGCVYREVVTIDKPLILRAAAGGSEIRGSEVWGEAVWSKRDSTWLSSKAVPRLITDDEWKCEPGVRQCRWPEQVFVDGRQLTQVIPATPPGPGQFAVNAGRRIILGESPVGKLVEVTVRNHWVEGNVGGANEVTIDGFAMKHATSDGILNSGNDNWTVKNGDYSYSHTSNVLIKRATGAVVSGNEIHHAGQKGVAGNEVDLVLQGNEIYANNSEKFNSSWNAGGVKISNPQTVTFAGNTVYDNRGNGLWLDVPTDDQALAIRDNRVHHNDANGIRSEVTDDDVKIHNNVVWENGWGRNESKAAGISLNASQNNRVYDNVVAWNVNGIRVMNSNRSIAHPDETEYDSVHNVEVDHNDILMDSPPDDAYALGWIKTEPNGDLYDPAANNRGHDNRYWYPNPEASQIRYAWEQELPALGAFNGTSGEENARYLSDAEKEDLLAANDIPDTSRPRDTLAPSIAITTPSEGATYTKGQTVDARYSCEDEAGGTGLSSCQGAVPDGAPMDTGSTGSYSFTVAATDNAGNTTSLTRLYAVTEAPRPNCTITGTPAGDVISGTPQDDTICAGAGKDTIRGFDGDDTLRGDGGMDTLLGGPGDDALDGGLNTDAASYSASLGAVSASLATDSATGEGSDTLSGLENLVGSSKSDTLIGSNTTNALTGRGGNDTVRGGPGEDKVVGDSGADGLHGENGNDAVDSEDGVNGNDSLDGGLGTDTKVTDATERSIVGFP